MASLAACEGWEETLEDMMAFLDECESASTAGSTSPLDSGGDCAEQSRSLVAVADRQLQRRVDKRIHRNRARDREKRELLRLRDELVELETRQGQLTASRSLTKNDARSLASEELVAAWKRVAARQEARRRDAHDENVRLKERVVEQWNVLQCMKRIIERQLAEEARYPPRMSSRMVPQPAARPEIVCRLLTTSKEMFAGTDAWVSCANMTGQANHTCIRMLSPTQLVVEVVDRRIVPFGFRALADAFWNVLSHRRCATYCFFEEDMVVEGHDTVIRGQAFCEDDAKADGDSSVQRQLYSSLQKFAELERVVITNVGQSEFIEVAKHALPETKIDEHVWFVVEEQNTLASDASYMTMFGRVAIDFQHEASYSLPLSSTLANYYGSGLRPMLHDYIAAAEDALLQGQPSTPLLYTNATRSPSVGGRRGR